MSYKHYAILYTGLAHLWVLISVGPATNPPRILRDSCKYSICMYIIYMYICKYICKLGGSWVQEEVSGKLWCLQAPPQQDRAGVRSQLGPWVVDSKCPGRKGCCCSCDIKRAANRHGDCLGRLQPSYSECPKSPSWSHSCSGSALLPLPS